MYCTELLRQQHDQASTVALRLASMLEGYRDEGDAFPIAVQLARMLALLRIHLALEDVQLYPALIASGKSEVAAVAQQFQDEMGSLAADLELFVMRWSSSTLIASHFPEFRSAARALLAALHDRVKREDETLYPLADAVLKNLGRRAA